MFTFTVQKNESFSKVIPEEIFDKLRVTVN